MKAILVPSGDRSRFGASTSALTGNAEKLRPPALDWIQSVNEQFLWVQYTCDAATGGRSRAAKYIKALFFHDGLGWAASQGNACDPDPFIPVIDSRWVVVEHPIAIGAHSRPDLIPLVFYESLGRGLIDGQSKNIVGSIAIGEKEYGFAVGSPVGGLVVTVVEREPARRGQRVAVLLQWASRRRDSHLHAMEKRR
jgi:hypothetical protein